MTDAGIRIKGVNKISQRSHVTGRHRQEWTNVHRWSTPPAMIMY